MQIPYIDLGKQHKDIKNEILIAVEKIIETGQFIMGDELKSFEKKIANFCGTKYALGVANGTDALFLSLKALGIGEGDEVLTAPNSFLASASSIFLAGAKPVFVDVLADFTIDYTKLEQAITSKTKAIIPVHLTGKPAQMDKIMAIAQKHNLFVVEDCAQAIGAEFNKKKVGSFGNTGCFSLHPLKNLSACGDGGLITTNDDKVYEFLTKSRNHGLKSRDECEFWSYNSRLDNIQAAILNIKFDKLDIWNNRRREIASIYCSKLKEFDIVLPFDKENEKSVYHTFIIQTSQRDALKNYLAENGVDTKIHYPIPIHLQESAKYLGYKKGDFPITEKQCETILSLPIFPELTNEQIDYICSQIINFFKK